MDRKAFVYLHAISTIKKYPLPIISRLQLKSLHGIGETLTEEIVRVIKDHYRNYVRKEENKRDGQEEWEEDN
jgi:ERCC4-type nuclease